MDDRPTPEKCKIIPENAKNVFNGVIFDIYQWDQKMFDGSFQKFEMLKRPDTAVIITTLGDKIILLEEEQPGGFSGTSFCTGRIEKDEKVLDGALRELEEETGIIPNEIYYIGSEQPQIKLDWFVHFFITEGIKKRNKTKDDPGEKIKVIEVSVDEVLLMCLEMKLQVPNELQKLLLKNQANEFRDRFLHPSKYFERVEK